MSIILALIQSDQDSKFLENLYLKYKDSMLNIAFYYLENKEDAEDAVSDVFVSIAERHLDKLINYPSEKQLKFYLFTSVKNSAINRIKKNKNNIKNILLANEADYIISDDEFINAINSKFEFEKLKLRIKELPDKYREVFVYKYLYDLSVTEISKLLNIKAATINKQLQRSKHYILEGLSENGQ